MTDPDFPLEGKRIFVAGHRGMVGSAIVRALRQRDCEILLAPRPGVDLRRQEEVECWMQSARPDAVFLAAGQGRRYLGQLYSAGGVHLRQLGD